MALETLLSVHHPPRQGISVLITDDEEIRRLNKLWRNKDQTTDVLSWPAPDIPGEHLGDIAISVETAAKQAVTRRVSLTNEAAMLAIHGGLHLLGFDDQTETEYDLMQIKMREVAELVGLSMKGEWGAHGEPT